MLSNEEAKLRQQEILERYGKKMVNNNFFGKIMVPTGTTTAPADQPAAKGVFPPGYYTLVETREGLRLEGCTPEGQQVQGELVRYREVDAQGKLFAPRGSLESVAHNVVPVEHRAPIGGGAGASSNPLGHGIGLR